MAAGVAGVAGIACAAAVAAAPVHAQSNQQPLAIRAGVVGSTFVAPDTIGIGVRANFATRPDVAFELQADWLDGLRTHRYVDRWIGFYMWKVKHTLALDSPGVRPTLSYGTAGMIFREPDARDRGDPNYVLPIFPVVGIGIEQAHRSSPTVYVDADFVIRWGGGLLPRVSAGLSFPIR